MTRWGRRGSVKSPEATRATVRRGVLGAVLTLLCAGTIALLAMPPFLPADESAHAGYALEVADGRLPRLEDTVKVEMPGQRPLRMYLANHPPLYYAITGPVLELSVDHHRPVAGVRLVRGFSLLLAAGTVAITAALAGVVVKRRRVEAMILAAGIAASVPTFVSTSAMIHNDLLAVFAATAAYYGAVAALVRGPRRGYVALVCVGSAVTMATRLNGAPIVALACAALGVAVLLHDEGGRARRLVKAALLGASPLVAAAAASGWFYLRNIRIYGDISGVGQNRELGGHHDGYTPLGYLTDRLSLPDLLTRVENGGPWRDIQFFGWYDRKVLALVVGVVAVGAVLAGVDVVRRYRGRGGEDAPADRAERIERIGRWMAIGLVVALPVLLWVQLSGYVSQTGTPNPRYLFPGVPAMAVVVAVCCLAYRRRAGVVVGVAVVSFQIVIGLTTLGRWLTIRTGVPRVNPFTQLRNSLEAADVPAPGPVLALLVTGAFVGVALQASAMWTATVARRPTADPQVADDPAASAAPALPTAPVTTPTPLVVT